MLTLEDESDFSERAELNPLELEVRLMTLPPGGKHGNCRLADRPAGALSSSIHRFDMGTPLAFVIMQTLTISSS